MPMFFALFKTKFYRFRLIIEIWTNFKFWFGTPLAESVLKNHNNAPSHLCHYGICHPSG